LIAHDYVQAAVAVAVGMWLIAGIDDRAFYHRI
jgi:hypothetical protein